MSNEIGQEEGQVASFQSFRTQIEEKIDNLISGQFNKKTYDSKEAQKWCNDTSE